MIREDFLHYLWQYKLFDILNIESASKETLEVINAGQHNFNEGPDFLNAQIKIGRQLWAGNVEIHVKSSDWYVHNHETDTAYDNVILHVVWEHDVAIFRKDNSKITTLPLKQYVPQKLLHAYQQLFSKQNTWINCDKHIAKVSQFTLDHWKERLYLERLEHKSTLILNLLKQSNNDWEAVLFKLIAKNFGLKVNGASFFNMANSFDFSIWRKNQSKLINLEALLFGQAHFFDDEFEDPYFISLKKEYQFLQKKYKLQPIFKNDVKFFRLRPSNFPTIRLSQLANLYANQINLFSKIITAKTLNDYYDLFQSSTSTYWETHYSFKSTSKQRVKKITKSFIDLLIINTILPLRFVYQKYIGQPDEAQIFTIIKTIPSETNAIIHKFAEINIKSSNALESQALIQLKNDYCNKQKCLQCAIGNALLSNT